MTRMMTIWLMLFLHSLGFAASILLRGASDAHAGSVDMAAQVEHFIAKLGEKYYQGNGDIDVYYISEMLDKLIAYLKATNVGLERRYKGEIQRLQAAIQVAPEVNGTKAVLEKVLKNTQYAEKEADTGLVEMLQFYHTAKAAMGSESGSPGCRFLACGAHASCMVDGHSANAEEEKSFKGIKSKQKGRASCVCNKCFEGDGFVCKPTSCTPATDFSAQPLIGDPPWGYPLVPRKAPIDVVEIDITVLKQDWIAVVARDGQKQNRGVMVVGQVTGTKVHWGAWQIFTPNNTAAFGPVISGLPSGRFALAFRDQDRQGVAYAIGGYINVTGKSAALGATTVLARNQGQHMALVPLASSRIACLFAQHGSKKAGHSKSAYGGATLLQVRTSGSLDVLGKYRFVDGIPVSRISAVALSPTSFVIAYRHVPATTSQNTKSQELTAVWAGMVDNELVVDPHPLYLEQERASMWARDVSLVSQDMISYSYESGSQRETKMALIHVDPGTHNMTVVGGPQVVGHGDTSYVKSISLPAGHMEPRTFTFYQHPGEAGMAEVCKVSPEGKVRQCKDVMWADAELKAVSAGRLQDGRLVFAFSNMAGASFYQLLSDEESGMVDVVDSK